MLLQQVVVVARRVRCATGVLDALGERIEYVAVGVKHGPPVGRLHSQGRGGPHALGSSRVEMYGDVVHVVFLLSLVAGFGDVCIA